MPFLNTQLAKKCHHNYYEFAKNNKNMSFLDTQFNKNMSSQLFL